MRAVASQTERGPLSISVDRGLGVAQCGPILTNASSQSLRIRPTMRQTVLEPQGPLPRPAPPREAWPSVRGMSWRTERCVTNRLLDQTTDEVSTGFARLTSRSFPMAGRYGTDQG